ncbi:MAG: YhbY family RNA-binding protein [Burkholderiaceae bacterium]|nr:YhbY family RNA-binding protein [Burkholderiaceae bacterium]
MKLNRTYTLPLDASERKALKGLAHHLDPVVIIGDAGLTDSVLAEIGRALAIHELIKIRVFGDDRAARDQHLTTICERTGCAPVQRIGKLLVVYLPRPPKEISAKGPHVPKKQAAYGATAPRPTSASTKKASAKAARSSPSAARPAASGAKRRAPIAKSSWARPVAQSPGRAASSAGTRAGPRSASSTGTRSGPRPASSTGTRSATRPPRSAAGGVRTGVTRRASKKT